MSVVAVLQEALGQLETLHQDLRASLSAPGLGQLDACTQALDAQFQRLQAMTQNLDALQQALQALTAQQREQLREGLSHIQQLQAVNQELIYLGMERVENLMSRSGQLEMRSRYDRSGRWMSDCQHQQLAQG